MDAKNVMNRTGKELNELQSRNCSVRLKIERAENEVGNDEDDGCGDDLIEGVLDERLEPTPEEPFELWDDEEWNEDWADQDTDGGGDKADRR